MVIYKRALSASLLAPLVIAGVVGCSTQPREELTPQKSDSAPESAVMTEQEALDAAQQAYGEYLAMSDLIAQEGGLNSERLKPFVTDEQYTNETEGLSNYSSSNLHLAGSTSFDSVHIANPDPQNFSVYLCIDNTNARIVDSRDLDVTPLGRVERWPLVVSFSFQSESHLVSGSETWTGSNFC
jgi:hypothetical protein